MFKLCCATQLQCRDLSGCDNRVAGSKTQKNKRSIEHSRFEKDVVNGDNCLTSKEWVRVILSCSGETRLNEIFFFASSSFHVINDVFKMINNIEGCNMRRGTMVTAAAHFVSSPWISFCHNSYNFTIVLDGTDVCHSLMSRLDDLVRIHKNFPCARLIFFLSLRHRFRFNRLGEIYDFV